MAKLSDLVKRLPKELQYFFDYTSFWIPKTNSILDMISQVLKNKNSIKEAGVEVENLFWVNLPADCRQPVKVYEPRKPEREYEFSESEDQIRLLDSFEQDPHIVVSCTVLGQSSIQIIDSVSGVNAYANKLFVGTSGADTGKTAIISRSDATGGGNVVIHFLHPFISTPAITAGYIVSGYVVLEYVREYPRVASPTDEVPLNDMYEDLIVKGLEWQAESDIDKGSQETQYSFQMWQFHLGLAQGENPKLPTEPPKTRRK